MSSQAALAIALMRTGRRHDRFNDHAFFGLDLDDVLLGSDRVDVRAPTNSPVEPIVALPLRPLDMDVIRREARQQRERQENAARRRAAWEEKCARDRAEQEKKRARDLEDQRAARAAFDAQCLPRFSHDFLEDMRQRGWAFEMCSACGAPFWIMQANVDNWRLYWSGRPRCATCFCPPLTERVHRENVTWSWTRVSQAILSALRGSGEYSGAAELRSRDGGDADALTREDRNVRRSC